MAHTIPHLPQLRLARPIGIPPPTGPVPHIGARSRASGLGLGGPGSGADGERAGDRHGDAGAG